MFLIGDDDYLALFCEIEPLRERAAGRETVFLHAEEAVQWRRIRAENYRRSWFAARVCTKILWNSFVNETKPDREIDRTDIAWSSLRIVSRNAADQGVRPVLFDRDRPTDSGLSISHSDTAVLVALARQTGRWIGCDLVPLGSVTEGMKRLFLSEADAFDGAATTDRLWAVKEAAYKSGHAGEAFVPARWHVVRQEGERFFCRNSGESDSEEIRVATRLHGEHVVAVAVTGSGEMQV